MNKKKMKTLSFVTIPAIAFLGLSSFTNAKATLAESAHTFYTDYSSLDEAEEDAAKLNEELEAESVVLLKNEAKGLPYLEDVNRISVFGVNSRGIFNGGGGSGSSASDPNATLEKALTSAGFSVNPKLVSLYAHASISSTAKQIVELPVEDLEPAYDSYNAFNDAAVIVISRTGSEFSDNAAYNAPGHKDVTEHYLSLQDNERALIKHVEDHFSRVTVLINSASPLELGDIEDDEKIQSVLWIGFTGYNGVNVLGDVLRGKINPSGRTVDIYPRDFKKDPTWNNFSDNSQVAPTKGEDGKYTFTPKSIITNPDGSAHMAPGWKQTYREVEYEEGIYVGYRYYETADAEAKAGNYNGFDYDKAVVYPFGYGKSYTTFSWELVDTPKSGALDTENEIQLKVKVTNTGSYAGKDVVEAYYKAPYTKNGIEKAEVNLVDFAKTKLLLPGESQTVTLTFKARDMASFDYNDANSNSFTGYELEKGDYVISLRSDSHTVKDGCEVTYNLAESKQFGKSDVTDKDIKAYYSQDDLNNTSKTPTASADAGMKNMSRANFVGTFPSVPTEDDLKYSKAALDLLDSQYTSYAYTDKETDSWYQASVPSTWKQLTDAEAKAKPTAADRGVDLTTMIGKSYSDASWDTVLNNLSYEEMVTYLNGNSRKMNGIEGIGKLKENDDDGPAQLKNSQLKLYGMSWVCEVNIASTWNKELANRQGQMVGNESLLLNLTGWYGPACDTHRSPLSGRNFEYYSQDGVQGGKIAAEVVRGARSKGMHVYLKHFALNDQEMNRGTTGGVLTYVNEQAMREVYLKQFQIAVEEGDCNGTMASFNRIGIQRSINYDLYVNILEGEWGFEGVSDSDIGTNKWPGNTYVRCHVYPMGSVNQAGYKIEGTYDKDKNMVYVAKDEAEATAGTATLASPTQWTALRETVHKSLYTYVNSNAIKNGIKTDSIQDGTGSGKVATTLSNVSAAVSTKEKEVSYKIISGSLPEGVRFDEKTGAFSGSPMVSGKFDYVIRITFDGWITKDFKYTLTVAPGVTLDKTEAVVGTAYTGALTSDVITSERNYSNLAYSVAEGELPEGLTLASDGAITGTPTKAGVYTFKANLHAEVVSRRSTAVYNFKETFTITVKNADGTLPTDTPEEDPTAKKIAELEKELADMKATDTANKDKIAELEKEIAALKDNANKDTDNKSDTESGGCGGSVIAAASTVGALALLGGALLLKKRKDEDDK